METSVLYLRLGRFTAGLGLGGIRVSPSQSEVLVLYWKPVDCSLQVRKESLPRVREYLRIWFRSDGQMEVRSKGGLMHSQL